MTNLIIIDASGSMASKREEVRGGLKELFKQIKQDFADNKSKKKKSPTTIVVDFSSGGDFNVLVNSNKLEELTDTVADSYKTRGMTALYDAMGKGFLLVDKEEKDVFVTILTDGEENDSKEFSGQAIKDLIEDKKKSSWAITFMGTTEAAIGNAVSLGISRGNTVQFADSQVGATYSLNKMSNVRSAYYKASQGIGGQSLSSVNLNTLMEDDKTEENQ